MSHHGTSNPQIPGNKTQPTHFYGEMAKGIQILESDHKICIY